MFDSFAGISQETQMNIVQTVTGGMLPENPATQSQVDTAVNTVLFFAGGVALIFIVIGGFRYVTSGGDPQKVSQAKDTLLYSIIGLIIAMSAFLILNLVIGVVQSS